jgi:hypothetical protein
MHLYCKNEVFKDYTVYKEDNQPTSNDAASQVEIDMHDELLLSEPTL